MVLAITFRNIGPEQRLTITDIFDGIHDTIKIIKNIPVIEWCTTIIQMVFDLSLVNLVVFISIIFATIFILAQIFS